MSSRKPAMQAQARAQRRDIRAAYRRLKFPGRPPHWVMQTAKLHRAGTLPERLAHLHVGDAPMARALVASLEPLRREWVKDRQWAAGKHMGTDARARAARAGGKGRGAQLQEQAESDLREVLHLFGHAHGLPAGVKLHARTVAQWWVGPAQCPRSLAQRLRKFELAT